MSLMNYFSIGYQIEKENNKSNFSNKYFRGNLQSEGVPKNNLNQSVIETLIKFGFELEQIMFAFKIYKFYNLDDAIYIMMKDNETGKYNHRFIKKEVENINNINDQEIKLENKNNSNKNDKKNNDKNFENIADIKNDNLYLNIEEKCFICGGLQNEHVDYEFKEIKLVMDPSISNNNSKFTNKLKDIKQNISEVNQSNSNCKINIENDFSKNLNLLANNKSNLGMIIENDLNKENFLDDNNQEIEKNNNNKNGEDKENITNIDTKLAKSSRNKSTIKKGPIMRSEIMINIDKETLQAFEDPEICNICFENKLNKDNSFEFSCGHKFCKSCIKSHLTINITNGKVR